MAINFNSGSYGLRQVSSANKTVLMMKLTDSALRFIESYQDNAGSLRSRPNIQFQGHQGIIQIPVPGGGDHDMQKFKFQVSNLPPSAGVDCLQQIRSGHTGRVECLGSVHQKITINAKDDSYDMTRQRMTLAKQEEQKTSTKVIKQPGSNIGKGYKKTGKGRVIEKSHLPSKGKLSPDTRAPTPPLSRLTPTLLNRSSSPLTISSKDRSASPPVPGSGRNKTKPTISISSSSSTSQKGGTSPNNGNGAVAARPLWDRVAHLLALRPYKLPEIFIRLQRDKPADKTRLQDILSQVASTRNVSGGVTEYSLVRNILPSLEPDTWPGYTDKERKEVKKKIAEMNFNNETRKRPYSNTLSPPETNSDGGAHDEEYSNPTSKKQRVSHIKGRTSGGSSPLDVDKLKPRSPGNAISFGTTQLPSTKTQPPTRKESRSPEKHRTIPKRSPTKPYEKKSPPKLYEKKSPPKIYEKKSPPKSLEKRSPPTQALDLDDNLHGTNGIKELPEDDDFLKKYTQISSDEQRDRYKKDFYAEYQEYLKHHSNVAAVSDKFAQLQQKLSEHEKGSAEYKAISRQVIQEYRKTKKNDAYHQERERWQFLHRKLRHIKELVNAFDQHKLANNVPENDKSFSMPTKTATRVA